MLRIVVFFILCCLVPVSYADNLQSVLLFCKVPKQRIDSITMQLNTLKNTKKTDVSQQLTEIFQQLDSDELNCVNKNLSKLLGTNYNCYAQCLLDYEGLRPKPPHWMWEVWCGFKCIGYH